MIELSFMPAAMAKPPNRYMPHYLVSEPDSLEHWTALVRALLAHLRERYGIKALRSWLFTVWREPDTPEVLFGFSTDEAFYRFYAATWQAVKDCDPGLRCGSPATFYLADAEYPMWYLAFLDLFLDQALAEIRAKGFRQLPVYLTEWNHTPSQQDLLNDTCFRSCYLTKTILQNYDRIASFGVWSVTDLMAETGPPQALFFGGLGLFTQNGIPKAGYHALVLLSRLGDRLVGKGDGWFATRQGEEYRIILYNYCHFSHLYATGERFDMTDTDRYTPFSPERSLDVHNEVSFDRIRENVL